MTQRIAIVGAGVVGLCCAWALRRAGVDVTLFERDAPGNGCSFGNAGMIQTGSVMPLATPALLRSVPRMLLQADGPLVLRWRSLPGQLGWFARLLAGSGRRRQGEVADALAGLLARAREAYQPMLDATGAGALMPARGELYVFQDPDAAAGLAGRFALYRRHGVRHQELDANGLARLEPALGRRFPYGYYLPDSHYVVDPLALSQAIAGAFVQLGGELRRQAVLSLRPEAGGVALATAQGRETFDRVVIATGAAAPQLLRPLGWRLPVIPLRGYHLMLPADGVALQGPVIAGDMNIAATPMAGGIRVAGTVEFTRLGAAPDWRRADMLRGLGRRLLPSLASPPLSRWHGDRPGTPDGLPLVGPLPGQDRLWLATGHGTLGLTLAAVTGERIAAALTGGDPHAGLAALLPARYTSPLRNPVLPEPSTP